MPGASLDNPWGEAARVAQIGTMQGGRRVTIDALHAAALTTMLALMANCGGTGGGRGIGQPALAP